MKVLLFIWEILQNSIGLFLTCFYKTNEKIEYKDRVIRYCKGFPGGISLGSYIFVGTKNNKIVAHEYGHSIQSKWLGPLYLFIVGIPSLIWSWLYGPVIKYTKNGYYKFYTEKWADKLGKVKR